jgi:hypothetical protein
MYLFSQDHKGFSVLSIDGAFVRRFCGRMRAHGRRLRRGCSRIRVRELLLQPQQLLLQRRYL